MSDPLARHQRFVENGKGTVDVAGADFDLGKRDFKERVAEWGAVLPQKFGAATHFLESAADRGAIGGRQALEKNPKRSPDAQIMLICETREFVGVQHGAREVAAHQLEHGRVPFPVRARAGMGEARDPRLSVDDKRNRALDVAHGPQYEREVKHG